MREEPVVEQLLQRASAGEELALSQLIERTLPGLRAYVARRLDRTTASKESVSDLVQSACREVIQGYDAFEYEGELPFRAYLYRTAMNKVIDRRRYYRAEKRSTAQVLSLQDVPDGATTDRMREGNPGPDQVVVQREEIDLLDKAWAQLPEDLREILMLRRVYGLSNRRAAEQLGSTEARTRHLLARALARLTTLYDDDCPALEN
ncbi:MAG: RNA polymerase sigma factor (sigma-70 family) [Planctomycetota bacterium]|jgi:RNA polymerase sigma factor (sigma-70 family)